MKLLTIFGILASVVLGYSAEKDGWTQRLPPTGAPSDLDMAATSALLTKGISTEELAHVLHTIPLLGAGSRTYPLKDGCLTIPLYVNRATRVLEWKLWPYEAKKAGKGADGKSPPTQPPR